MRDSATKKIEIAADLSCNLIQSIRLIHAISEADVVVAIPSNEAWKFDALKHEFGMKFVLDEGADFRLSDYATLYHETPAVRIGEICRPLVFPHVITSHCRTLWKSKRQHKYAFTGLVTKQRRLIISQWMQEQFSFSRGMLLWHWARLRLLNHGVAIPLSDSDHFVIDASLRGRQFPKKCWDASYYQLLANSQFVLCPSGDFVWTYRFFEAILCGAIPIVQESCPAYEGFKFIKLSDSPESAIWSPEIAEFNYNLCVQRITVPLPELSAQLSRW